jgi:hypothetical protein
MTSVGTQHSCSASLDASGDPNDLWAYSIDNQQWTQLTPPKSGKSRLIYIPKIFRGSSSSHEIGAGVEILISSRCGRVTFPERARKS